jgi:GNAT superfamily N-acetyltransferase
MARSDVAPERSTDLRPLTQADVAGGLALSAAAGWNQTADDWSLFIGRGHAFGVRDADGRLIATAAALPYGGGLGWISMVLVAPEHRHRGLATRLMARCVDALQDEGIRPVLDATPAGAQVYRRIGFEPGFALERWEGEGGDAPSPVGAPGASRMQDGHDDAPRPSGPGDLDAMAALDAAATGLGRAWLLQAFVSRPQTRAWLTGAGDGFLIARAGHRAAQLGPLVAPDERRALSLLHAAVAAARGPVFLDVPARWSGLAAWLMARGFRRQRPFVRMALGGAHTLSAPDRLFVLAGPEFG